MMAEDSLAPWQRSGLKVAFRHLVERVGGFDVAEMIGGRRKSVLHGYANLHDDAMAPVDVVLRMEQALVDVGGQPLVSALLVRSVGYLAVPVPEAAGDLGQISGAVVREAADMAARHVAALGDGKLSDAERAQLAAHCDTLIDFATRMRAVLAGPALKLMPGRAA